MLHKHNGPMAINDTRALRDKRHYTAMVVARHCRNCNEFMAWVSTPADRDKVLVWLRKRSDINNILCVSSTWKPAPSTGCSIFHIFVVEPESKHPALKG